MTITADCELWLNGQRVPDRAHQLEAGTPTALSALTINWGREDTASQPDAATCQFALHDGSGAESALNVVHVGMPVQVYASGITGGGQDYYPDPGFDTLPLGPLPVDRYGQAGTGAFTPTVIDVPDARVVRLSGTADAALWITPLAFSGNPAAWDGLPQMTPGQTWTATLTARLPQGATGQLVARAYTAPNVGGLQPDATLTVNAPPIVAAGHPVTVTGTVTLTGAVPAWIALGLSVALPAGPSWAQSVGVWTEHPEPWESYATADIYRVQATTQGALVRRVLVFAGSVTDAVATPSDVDLGAITLDVTAADITAELGSDVIGGEPWTLEALGARVARIQALSRLQTPVTVDASLSGIPVSWRDVDAQNVLDLLRDLAQTGGGVLWPSAHATTGGYLWVEDPAQRAALRTLAMDSGVIVVTGATQDVDLISACDVLRDPVQLAQTVTEITTTVTVQWKDQTLDDEGNQAPTDRSHTATDETALTKYGLRSLQVSTELTSDADAANLAQRTLAKSRGVAWKASGYTLDTSVMPDSLPSVPQAQRIASLMSLLDGTVRIGHPIALLDLPDWLPVDASRAYVEGGSYSYDSGWWVLALTISPAETTDAAATWGELPTTWHWDEWEPGLRWADLVGVGYEPEMRGN